jgi:hypothetical protein
MSDEPKTGRLEIRVPEALINAIEKWRLRQTVPPSRSAAIRYLIESGLEMRAAAHSGGGPGGAKKPRAGKSR